MRRSEDPVPFSGVSVSEAPSQMTLRDLRMRLACVWLLLVALGAATGCDRHMTTPAKAHPAPAKADRIVAEAELNTIQLTPEALDRLGLKTSAVEQRQMRRVRS